MHLLLVLVAEGEKLDLLDPKEGGGAFWTWVIFLVALPFIWKVVMGPVTRALEERDDRTVKAIAAAEKASQEAEKARADVEVKLGEAQAAAARLLAEARGRGEQREREIIENAKLEGEALRRRARAEIETAKEQALAAIRDEVVDLSLAAAAQVLKRRVSSEDDRRLASEIVAGAAGAASGTPGKGA